MQFSLFDYYLIGINVLGFILFAVNIFLYTFTLELQIDKAVTVTALLGGSLGIFISIIIFSIAPKKEILMSRVFIVCVLIIQIILFLIIKGYIKNDITIAFWTFLENHQIFLLYLLTINVITFIVFLADKVLAIKHKYRIRNVTLLVLSIMGGSIGGIIAMYAFRHKINKDYYSIGLPLMLLMQLFVLFFLMNGKI